MDPCLLLPQPDNTFVHGKTRWSKHQINASSCWSLEGGNFFNWKGCTGKFGLMCLVVTQSANVSVERYQENIDQWWTSYASLGILDSLFTFSQLLLICSLLSNPSIKRPDQIKDHIDYLATVGCTRSTSCCYHPNPRYPYPHPSSSFCPPTGLPNCTTPPTG